jgi:hypothetical protein
MPDYQKSKIYKLTTPQDENLVYYGSTTISLSRRKSNHKLDYIKRGNKMTSSKLFELGVNDVIITLVEEFVCESKEELIKRERFYIENNQCINKNIPGRTKQEYQRLPESIEKDKLRKQTEHYKETAKKRLQIPEVREKIKERKRSPEYKEKRNLYLKNKRRELKNKL